MTKKTVHVIGSGLAGTECALQLASLGYDVVLVEMRSVTMTPAHKTADAAELVCSNSLGSLAAAAAPGQLKWEAEQLGSRIVLAALETRVPAGQSLSVDREKFAKLMNKILRDNKNIRLENRVVKSLAEIPRPCIVATGPLTHDRLAESLLAHFGESFLYFFDAIAPIVDAESVDMNIAWRADRWDKGTKDYVNCPLNKQQYFDFIAAIKAARKIEPKEFEKNTPFFESCMPIEGIVERGPLTLRFGPMSAKGLPDPRTGKPPFAAVQLRQENRERTSYNMVGFQTKMAYADQKEVFRGIPGLERAEFLKLGGIHRNLYINSPQRLHPDLSSRQDPLLFFAGQITGVEGYFESTCIGLLAARFLDQKLRNAPFSPPPRATALGSLLHAITDPSKPSIQPTNINFGLMPPIEQRMDKLEKRALQIEAARTALRTWMQEQGDRERASQIEAASDSLKNATEANLRERELAPPFFDAMN